MEENWTLGTLHTYFSQQLADLRVMLDERYATQTKALDAAFASQQTAVRKDLESAEKAVAVAMTATEKAGAKQEVAAEKRFDLLNELRVDVPSRGDIKTLEVLITSQGQQVEGKLEALSTLVRTQKERLDLLEGRSKGAAVSSSLILSAVVVIGVILTIVVTLTGH